MDHEVYISYSSRDSEIAAKICEILEVNNVECWFRQRDLKDNANYDLEVENAIENSRAVVLVSSASSFESDSVRNDVNVAYSSDVPIVSFKIDDFQDFLEDSLFILSVLQWIDGYPDVENSYVDLVIGVKRLLEHEDLDPEEIKYSIFKSAQQITGVNNLNDVEPNNPSSFSYVYLSYEDIDLDFISPQVHQYESLEVNFTHDDDSQIEDCALLVVFISKNSHKSPKIKDDIIKAIKNDVGILLIHLDEAEPDFGRIFKLRYGSKLKKAIKFSIFKTDLDELTYIEKCDEIFQLYGVKNRKVNRKFTWKDLENQIKTKDEITLTEDILINKDDSAIDLNRDNMVIDGQGHSISAENVENLFSINSKNITIKNILFKDCRLNNVSSMICVSKDSSLMLRDCNFESNMGQVIFNLGETNIINSIFLSNGSNDSPILSKGQLKIENCEFKSNKTHDDGGVILNEGESYISNSRFIDNACENNGGAIYNRKNLFLENNEFLSNEALNKGSSIYNASKTNCFNTVFSHHGVKSDIIFNESMMEFMGCKFVENAAGITIENGQDAFLSISKCNFIYNEINKANIYNAGRCDAMDVVFELNRVDCKNSFEIYNEGFMTLKRFKIDENAIFNDGNLTADRRIICGTVSRTIGIDKPFAEPEGIVKPQEPIYGQTPLDAYVYLSYDEADLDFINSQTRQYEHLNVNFEKDNSPKIFTSSLLAVFVSKNSYESFKIRDDINNAYTSNVPILLIYLDDVKSEFETSYTTFEDSKMFTIEKYELSELEYISKYSEIFQLYGVKSKVGQDETLESMENHEIRFAEGLTFTDLDNLIKNNNKITITDDIHLIETESSKYENGIDLVRDDLIIDGNDHSIFATDINKIFNVTSKSITFKNLNFRYCILRDASAIIHVSEDSSVTLDNCTFQSNDLDDGHVIYTLGDVNVKSSKFEDNHSKNEGAAIFARDGRLNITDSDFIDNESQNSGGAILNWVKLNITDCRFINNHAQGYGGAIGNVIDANLNVSSSEFIENEAIGEASAIYNENKAVCVGCNFTKNSSKLSLIFNENSFDLVNCNFKNNRSRIIFQNDESGVSYLSNSKFIENEVMITNVYNNGESFSMEKVEFKDNKSAYIQAVNIYNETYMRLKEPKLDDNTILNSGHMDIWKYDSKLINSNGTISVMDGPCDQEFSFDWLDKRINQSDDELIRLEHNIKLENCELDFYEGGMEISRSNLTIDGDGHYIDGAKRTAILYVTGKNVTLKNIKFRNANLINDFYKHITGGSAIRTVTSSSLKVENCEFTDNECDDDGGAILNRSQLEVSNSRFENNSSKSYGGAICNKNTLALDKNEFINNASRIKEDVFNSRRLEGNFSIENVFDVGEENHESKSYSYLRDKLFKADEVILDQDIKFDYKLDQDFKNGIEIADRQTLTIDGAGFSIDGDDRAALFNVKNSNVIFKNITFKNAIAQDFSIIENDAKATFISCKFINNHVSYDKSLIDNNGHVMLEGCKFINNMSKNKSLISNNDEFEIIHSDFCLNSNEKSTIANNGHLSIADSNFINNHSYENAGAIRNEKEAVLEAENSRFKSNSTLESGGAILNYGDGMFLRCIFESNFAEGDGGVINNEKDANIKIISSNIIDNSSKGDGGAIINWGNLIFENSIFNKNTARKDGGVVNIQKGTLKIDSCEFNENDAFDGGSIFNRGELSIENTKFENNTAKKDGGVLNTYKGNIKITKSLFEKNNASDGGAIYSREAEILIYGSEFSSNVSDINGGAIITWCEMAIEDSRLVNNSAKIYGGAINNQKQLLTLKNCELLENIADTGGAIFNVEDDNLKTIDCKFKENSPDDIY